MDAEHRRDAGSSPLVVDAMQASFAIGCKATRGGTFAGRTEMNKISQWTIDSLKQSNLIRMALLGESVLELDGAVVCGRPPTEAEIPDLQEAGLYAVRREETPRPRQLDDLPLKEVIRLMRISYSVGAGRREELPDSLAFLDFDAIGRWTAETIFRYTLMSEIAVEREDGQISAEEIETLDRYYLAEAILAGEKVLALNGNQVVGEKPTPTEAAKLRAWLPTHGQLSRG
jgi:hypothetical protein